MKQTCFFALAALLFVLCLLSGCQVPSTPPAETTAPVTAAPVTAAPETAAPAPSPLQLTGGEHTYTIVRDENFRGVGIDAAVALRAALSEGLEEGLGIKTDWYKPGTEPSFGEYEILLGATNRPESAALAEGLGMYDYKIAVMGEKLVIVGGCEEALAHAVAHILRRDVLAADEAGSLSVARDYTYHFDGADSRAEYLANPDLFLCSWVLKLDVPAWMTDFAEKMAAFRDGDGRLLSDIHRADHIFYPENSLEGIISCIQMGADAIELDLRKTKDGVIVLMHDASLRRTTDWANKAARNGLPLSDQVADWTYAELQELRLRKNDGTQTDYCIPTFAEALQVCRERIFLHLDIKYEGWTWEADIIPLLEETGAWNTVILPATASIVSQADLLALMEEKSGLPVLHRYYLNFSVRANWDTIISRLNASGYYPIFHINGGWWDLGKADECFAAAAPYLLQNNDKMRIYCGVQTLPDDEENAALFEKLHANGMDFVLVDNIFNLQQYIAEHCSPTPIP